MSDSTAARAPAAASVGEFLDELEAPAPSCAGGTAAAHAGAMAAALVAMVGRGSPDWEEGVSVARRARALRDRLIELGEADVHAYAEVMQAMRAAAPEATGHDAGLRRALVAAARVPLAIAEASADVAELAALAGACGKAVLIPDAAIAAALSEAAAHSGAYLVEENLASMPARDDTDDVDGMRSEARAARARALGSL